MRRRKSLRRCSSCSCMKNISYGGSSRAGRALWGAVGQCVRDSCGVRQCEWDTFGVQRDSVCGTVCVRQCVEHCVRESVCATVCAGLYPRCRYTDTHTHTRAHTHTYMHTHAAPGMRAAAGLRSQRPACAAGALRAARPASPSAAAPPDQARQPKAQNRLGAHLRRAKGGGWAIVALGS